MTGCPEPVSDDAKKLAEVVESLCGQQITVRRNDSCGGDMSSRCDEETGAPLIEYRKYSDGGVVEELLHLKFMAKCRFREFKAEPSPPQVSKEDYGFYIYLGDQLASLVTHRYVFPAMECLGRSPRETATDHYRHVLQEELPKETFLGRSLQARVRYCAILYASAKLECDQCLVAEVEKVFSESDMSEAIKLGTSLAEQVERSAEKILADPSPETFIKALGECACTVGIPLRWSCVKC